MHFQIPKTWFSKLKLSGVCHGFTVPEGKTGGLSYCLSSQRTDFKKKRQTRMTDRSGQRGHVSSRLFCKLTLFDWQPISCSTGQLYLYFCIVCWETLITSVSVFTLWVTVNRVFYKKAWKALPSQVCGCVVLKWLHLPWSPLIHHAHRDHACISGVLGGVQIPTCITSFAQLSRSMSETQFSVVGSHHLRQHRGYRVSEWLRGVFFQLS